MKAIKRNVRMINAVISSLSDSTDLAVCIGEKGVAVAAQGLNGYRPIYNIMEWSGAAIELHNHKYGLIVSLGERDEEDTPIRAEVLVDIIDRVIMPYDTLTGIVRKLRENPNRLVWCWLGYHAGGEEHNNPLYWAYSPNREDLSNDWLK